MTKKIRNIRKTYLYAVALLGVIGLSAASVQAGGLEAVATIANEDFPESVEHVAVLSRADGGPQSLTASHIDKFFSPGEPFGNEVLIDVSALWGSGGAALWGSGGAALWGTSPYGTGGVAIWDNAGAAVDIDVAAIPLPERDYIGPFEILTPDRLWVAINDGRIGEGRGVWQNGTISIPTPNSWIPMPDFWIPQADAWTPMPDAWLVHDTGLDTTCGPVTALGEGSARVDGTTDQILMLALGTAGGCVGLVTFADPDNAALDGALVAYGPLIEVAALQGLAGQVNDIVAVAQGDLPGDLPNHFDFLVSVNGTLMGLDPGSVSVGAGQVTEVTAPSVYAIDAKLEDGGGAQTPDLSFNTSVGAEPIRYGPSHDIIIPDGGIFFLGSPVIASDGSADVRVGVMPGDQTTFFETNTLTLSKPVSRVSVGSLAALTTDRESVLLLPQFNISDGDPGEIGEVELRGLQSVNFGPKTFNLSAHGKFVTVVIEASGDGVDVIDAASVKLNVGGITPAVDIDPLSVKTADRDGDGNSELVIKFRRSEVGADLQTLFDGGSEYGGWLLSWATSRDCNEDGSGFEACVGFSLAVVRILP